MLNNVKSLLLSGKKIYLPVFTALFFFFGNISSSSAQPCYVYDSIPFAPDSLTAPQLIGLFNDDRYSSVLSIGFNFCFYGNNYAQCIIGSNGLINFNIGLANGFCPASIPTNGFVPPNCIAIPWEDLFPPSGGTIRYQTMGTSPYRKFIVAFTNVPFFTPGICPGAYYTGQAILFETLNSIEIHILNNSVCTAWNSGAVIGIADSSGIDFTMIYPTSTSTPHIITNEAFRFSPVCSCPVGVEELDGSELNVQVFPNPSENNFNVSYELKQTSKITAGVYNTLGELISPLADDEKQSSGKHSYNLNLPYAGIYFLKLRIGDKTVSRKFVVMQ